VKKQITGQVVYCGPPIPWLGLTGRNIFKDGIYPHFYPYFEQCPALAELFIPMADRAAVARQLNIDIGRVMRGTNGKYVVFYHEVETWLAKRAKEKPTPTTGVKLEHHA
jgi:hypothetical protein